MDVKHLNAFLDAIKHVLTQFGVQDVKRGNLTKKENMNIKLDVTAVIGLTGKIRGNVSFSFSRDTAIKVVSSMMGMQVAEIDEIGRSALSEFANMVAGTGSTLLSEDEMLFDVAPPSLIMGKDIFFVISSVETIAVTLETSAGAVEVNFGLEG
ncbi:MAG: chemotaxis protein CheX [Candidatus Saccharibacteria bacterium]